MTHRPLETILAPKQWIEESEEVGDEIQCLNDHHAVISKKDTRERMRNKTKKASTL